MIRIAICDDSLQTTNYVEEYISQLPLHDIACEVFMSGDEMMHYLGNGNRAFNIYFLDIEMPGTNGVETAKFVRQRDTKALIIFITNHKEYVYQVFEVLPFRFVVKPITCERLNAVLHDAIESIQTMGQLYFFKKERETFQIPYSEIVYFEGVGRKVQLVSATGVNEFYHHISDIENELDSNLFLRIHASYIVNMNQIISIGEAEVNLKGGIRLPISKKFRQDAKIKHLRFMKWRNG